MAVAPWATANSPRVIPRGTPKAKLRIGERTIISRLHKRYHNKMAPLSTPTWLVFQDRLR